MMGRPGSGGPEPGAFPKRSPRKMRALPSGLPMCLCRPTLTEEEYNEKCLWPSVVLHDRELYITMWWAEGVGVQKFRGSWI